MGLFDGSAGGIIGGLGSMIGSAISAKQQRKNTLDTIKYQKQAADLEYQRNLEQWNRENEWNLPKNQVQRMKDAGINPNLIAENAGSFGQAATSPHYNASRPDYSGRESIVGKAMQYLSMFNNIRMQNAQVDLVKEQTRNQAFTWDLKAMQSAWMKNIVEGRPNFDKWFNSMVLQRQGQYQQSVMNAKYKQIEGEWLDLTKGTLIQIADWLKEKVGLK